MIQLNAWLAALLGLILAALSALMVIWWRQQSFRWPIVAGGGLAGAILLSWWSGVVFRIDDYRAGCVGLCSGYRGAPIPFFLGETAGGAFLPGRYLLNALVYLALLLGWSIVVRSILRSLGQGSRHRLGLQAAAGLALLVGPFALSPMYLPPPEARVLAGSDPQRIAINAMREVYLYDQESPYPVLRVGLEDVRPRSDGQPGMRVCLRLYTFFYLPTGHMFLDMTPEGVHSNAGGVLAFRESCWK